MIQPNHAYLHKHLLHIHQQMKTLMMTMMTVAIAVMTLEITINSFSADFLSSTIDISIYKRYV